MALLAFSDSPSTQCAKERSIQPATSLGDCRRRNRENRTIDLASLRPNAFASRGADHPEVRADAPRMIQATASVKGCGRGTPVPASQIALARAEAGVPALHAHEIKSAAVATDGDALQHASAVARAMR